MPQPIPIRFYFVGVNTNSASTNHQKATKAINCDLTDEKSVLKRSGYRPLNGIAWNDNKIRSVIEFIKSSGNKLLVFGVNKEGTSGGYAYLEGTPHTSGSYFVELGITGTTRPSIIQFKDLIYIFKGSNDRIWDGTNIYRIGIPAPTQACTISDGGSGGYTNSGDYLVTYTYYNSVTGAESNPAPLSNKLTVSSNRKINITGIAAGNSSLADKIRIYRTVVNGDQLFLDKEISISSTTTTIAADASEMDDVIVANFILEWDNDLPVDTSIVHKIDNRIFAKIDKNRVGFSKISPQYGAMPQSWPVENFCDCNPNDGDEIIAINDANGIPIVIKKLSFGRLLQQSQDVYIYKEIAKIGGVSHHGCAKIGPSLAFLSRNNVILTDGLSCSELANDISDTIKNIDFTNYQNVSAYVNLTKKQIRFSVCGNLAGDGEVDTVLVGHYNTPIPEWTFYETRGDEFPSIRAGCFGSRMDERGVTEYLFGNAFGNGFLYQMDYGDTDRYDWERNCGIYFEYSSHWVDYDTDNYKLFKSVGFKFNSGGSDCSLMVGGLFDMDGDSVTLLESVDLASSSEVWQDGVDFTKKWGDFRWANPQPILKVVPIHKKARQFKVFFRQTDYGMPLELFNYTTYVIPFGKL